jgi:hypothetical protein
MTPPVEMTMLLRIEFDISRRNAKSSLATALSSRPERSVVERSAVPFNSEADCLAARAFS